MIKMNKIFVFVHYPIDYRQSFTTDAILKPKTVVHALKKLENGDFKFDQVECSHLLLQKLDGSQSQYGGICLKFERVVEVRCRSDVLPFLAMDSKASQQ